MNDKLTEIVVIMDRSGSMQGWEKDMEGGLRSFLEKQDSMKKDGFKANLTYVRFDDKYEVVFDSKDLSEIDLQKDISLIPRGSTALLDAMGKTINIVGDRLNKTLEGKKPSKVVVVIITDGVENASKEFKRQQIFDMIKHQIDKYNWQFVYLGADQDAIQEGQSMGFSSLSTANFTKSKIGIKASYDTLGNSVACYRSCTVSSVAFTDEDKKKMVENK